MFFVKLIVDDWELICLSEEAADITCIALLKVN